MKKILGLATGLALCASLAAPAITSAQAVMQTAPTVLVEKGKEVDAILQQPLNSKTNHDGDRFTLTQTDTFWHRKPQLKGAVIDGHVEHVSPAGAMKKATMNLVFDDMKLADGTSVPLSAKLISLKEVEPQTHKIRDTAIIVGSAVGGHMVGKSTGGTVAGAAAGVALVQTLKDDIKVKRGTILRLKLLQPIMTGAGNS